MSSSVPPSEAPHAALPGVWKLILIPVVVTWLVMLLRLFGELQGWSPSLFSTEAGGGGSPIGITWLVILFGAWFGWRLASSGRGPSRGAGRAVFMHLGAVVFVAGAMMLAGWAFGVEEGEFPPPWGFVATFLACIWAAALTAGLVAWPQLLKTNLGYAILARLGIVAVTFPAVLIADWDTHFSKMPEPTGRMNDATGALWLCMPQVLFWIPFTLLVGGLCGSVAALFVRKPDPRPGAASLGA